MRTRRCDETRTLRGAIGTLECSREAGHEGIHRDAAENLWWLPGAHLEGGAPARMRANPD